MTDDNDGKLTDYQLLHESVPCWCDRCGQRLYMHLLFPQVGPRSLEHACVAKSPVLFSVEVIEVKPMEMPISKILDPEWNREQWQREKAALRKGLPDDD